MTNVLVLGNSHIGALQAASSKFAALDENAPRYGFVPFLVPYMNFLTLVGNGTEMINPAILLALHNKKKLLGPVDAYVTLVGGNEHTMFGLMEHPQPYDFIVPGHESLPQIAGATLLPYAAVRDLLAKRIGSALRFLELFKLEAGSVPVIQFESPPPCPDNEFIEANGGDFFRRRGNSLHIASPVLRRKLWLASCDVYRTGCRNIGIGYASTPEETMDAEGFLVREGWRDAVHGSEWFGAHCLTKIGELTKSASLQSAGA